MKLFILLCLFTASVHACEIEVVDVVNSKTYDLINNTLERCAGKPVIVRANSEGGLATPLLATMDNIDHHGKVVWLVEEPNVCISACAWLGIAAKIKRGKFVFHGITMHDGRPSMENLRLQAWLYSRGVSFDISRQLITQDFVEIEFK